MSETIEQAKEKIKGAIRANGPFSHNIASLVLMGVSQEHGVDKANELIKELNLTRLYGIHPVDENIKIERREVKTAPTPVVEKKEEPKETPYERSRKRANEVLRKLHAELGQVSIASAEPVIYDLTENTGYEKGATEIRIQVLPEDHPSYNKKIRVFAALKGNGYYHHTNYTIYIRIDSDDWTLSFKKNWTPETKDLAKKVHAKVVEIAKSLKARYEQRVNEKAVRVASEEFLTAKFPGNTVYGNDRGGTAYTNVGKVEYRHESKKFGIELSGLTEEQLDRVIKIAAENRAVND